MKYLEDVLIATLISEKSYDRIADSNSYTFFVHTNSYKPEIKKAVQELFDVDVLSVNTMYRKGKKKRFLNDTFHSENFWEYSSLVLWFGILIITHIYIHRPNFIIAD